MSSYRTGRTSTTGSSSNSSSRNERPRGGQSDARARSSTERPRGGVMAGTAVIACGALGGHVREIAARRGWNIQVHNLPSMLHNSPREIAPAAERLATSLQDAGLRV